MRSSVSKSFESHPNLTFVFMAFLSKISLTLEPSNLGALVLNKRSNIWIMFQKNTDNSLKILKEITALSIYRNLEFCNVLIGSGNIP